MSNKQQKSSAKHKGQHGFSGNLEYIIIAFGVLVATAGQMILPAWLAVTAGVLIAGFAGEIAKALRK